MQCDFFFELVWREIAILVGGGRKEGAEGGELRGEEGGDFISSGSGNWIRHCYLGLDWVGSLRL
jgi:hypothetical protein